MTDTLAARLRTVPLALPAILVVAAATRLVGLDLMEFKADEAEACRIALHVLGYSEPGVGRFFPTTALDASIGLSFPPLFVYVLAIPLALGRNPLAAAAFVALTNVVAVWLAYVAGRRWFSRRVGLAAAALFALSPWAIVFSRKIWSPDLLPICTCAFAVALHEFLVERRSRAAAWMVVIVGVAVSFHFSAGLLGILTIAAFVLGRAWLRARHVAIGLGVVLLLYVPYVWHALVYRDIWHPASKSAPGIASRFVSSARDSAGVGFGDGLSDLVGSQSVLAFPLSVLLGLVAFGALVAGCRGWRTDPSRRARILLVVWFVLPLAALTVLPITPAEHYMIVLYPLPFLGLGLAFDAVARRRRHAATVALAGCLAALAVVDVQLFRIVVRDGGAPGDYGVAYKYKERAVRSFVRANASRQYEVSVPGNDEREYRFLDWDLRGAADKPLSPPTTRYVVTTELEGSRPPLGADEERFGPLRVRVVSLREAKP